MKKIIPLLLLLMVTGYALAQKRTRPLIYAKSYTLKKTNRIGTHANGGIILQTTTVRQGHLSAAAGTGYAPVAQFGNGGTSTIVNADGSHSVLINGGGNVSTLVNSDGSHSTIINNGATSTIVNPDGSHSVLINSGGNVSTLVNSDGSHSTIINNGATSVIVNPDGSHSVVLNQ